MVQRYSCDQLLGLRASPLVHKPSNLPPLDEWIGHQVEQRKAAAAGRAKAEDVFPFEQTRRNVSLESKNAARSPGAAPEDIVLGPPRLSFSSAMPSRGNTKTGDIFERRKLPSKENADSTLRETDTGRDHPHKDRGDRQFGDKDRFREIKVGANGNRRGNRDESDGWTSVKSRKGLGQDETDRGPRRFGDRDLKDGIEKGRAGEIPSKERENDRDTRRNGLGRARHESSWFRDADAPPPRTKETNNPPVRESHRDREWRDRDTRHERDWSRSAAVERDPEWMDEPAANEKQTVHTQEDFQRWKERMKAGSNPPAEPKTEPAQELGGAPRNTTTETIKAAQKISTPLISDDAEDGFFRMWNKSNDQAKSESQEPSSAAQKAASKPAAAKASRFTSFFSPAEVSKPAVPAESYQEPAGPIMPDASDSREDKEGFQRIMQMLGNTNIAGPQIPFHEGQQLASRAAHDNNHHHHINQANGQYDGHQMSKKPHNQPPSSARDAEFLQNLLFKGQGQNGISPHPDINDIQQNIHPNDVGFSPHNQVPGSYGGMPDYASPHQDGPSRQPQPQSQATHPAMLRRPPGLDSVQGGWMNGPPQQQPAPNTQQQGPQPGQPGQQAPNMAPPPGLSNNPNRGPPNHFPPFHPPPGIFPGDMGVPPGFFMGPPPGYPPPPPMGFPPGVVLPNASHNFRGQGQGLYDTFGEGRGIPPPDR